jgi:hypothetical protein
MKGLQPITTMMELRNLSAQTYPCHGCGERLREDSLPVMKIGGAVGYGHNPDLTQFLCCRCVRAMAAWVGQS